MTFKIPRASFEEMKALVTSGDTNLIELRSKFKARQSRETTLSDDELTAASFTEDDDDDELLVQNILTIENEGLEIVDTNSEQANQ